MIDLWKISSRFFIDFLNLKFYMAHPVVKIMPVRGVCNVLIQVEFTIVC